VTAPNGIDLGDFHIPCGVRVAAPNHHIQRDPDVYDDAERYNAFRYSAPRDNNDSDKAGAYLQQKQQSLSMPSDNFLAWGHGRHACPGRFFAAHLMKLMLAHVLVKYDVKADGPKPVGQQRNEFPVPSLTATFDVKFR
jgi:cytochrome P450